MRLEVGHHQAVLSLPDDLRPFIGLWSDVLRLAFEDARGGLLGVSPRYGDRAVATDALQWFRSEVDEVGSFVWICDLLGLDPDAVRASLKGLAN
jgi:hypothetical protein